MKILKLYLIYLKGFIYDTKWLIKKAPIKVLLSTLMRKYMNNEKGGTKCLTYITISQLLRFLMNQYFPRNPPYLSIQWTKL